MDLIRVRLAFEHKEYGDKPVSVLSTCRKIYDEKAVSLSPLGSQQPALLDRMPILKFYRGYFVSIMGMVPYAGVSFLVWGRLQNAMRNTLYLSDYQRRRFRTLLDLGSGALAGALSQTASYPFEVVRRRMQVGGLVRPGQLDTFRDTVRRIYVKNGWRGFFIGLSIGYLKVVPMTALSFATWTALKRVFHVP